MHLRSLLILASTTVLIHACSVEGTGDQRTTATAQTVETPQLTPLAGTKLRFDGFYHRTVGRNQYLMRFFPEGNVVVINGTDSTPQFAFLSSFLKQDAQNNTVPGLHNVPVSQQGDSLRFVTSTRRGDIDYYGKVLAPDSVHVYKYSHINGAKDTGTLTFRPDGGS